MSGPTAGAGLGVGRVAGPPAVQAAVEVTGLVAGHGPRTVLDGLSLRVAPGQVLAVLGPNGAGKTTLMDVLAGAVPVAGGTAVVGGYDLRVQPRRCRTQVGYAAQDLALFPTLTVHENVLAWAELGGLRRAAGQAAVRAELGALGLLDVEHRRVRELSGGQRRRVHCAMATVSRPPVLLLDEPTVGVDPATRQAVLRHVRRVADEGAAVLYSTHYLPEVESLQAEVMLLREGSVAAQGAVGDLLAEYGTTVLELRLSSGAHARPGDAVEVRTVPLPSGADLPQVVRGLGPELPRLVGLEVRYPTLDEVFDRVVAGAEVSHAH